MLMLADSVIEDRGRSFPTAITAWSAIETALLIRKKELSPVEVVNAYLDRIARVEPKINAFASLPVEQVLDEARHAEAAIMLNKYVGPLLGVPITVKSCIDVRSLRCEAGSRLRRGYVASEDATAVARLRQAGAILLGNTSTPEMLMAYHTDSESLARTNNPWDITRTAGGSS